MDARLARAALMLAAFLSLGAGRPYYSVRSQHFIVSAPTPQLAQEVAQAAEANRRDLAIEWLGRELPPWRDICPITVKLDPGAGGATSFVFQGGMPTQWTMSVQGSRERILDSVLPHEITHTIFATHFGRPLPRWADEGGATTVEHTSEKAKQDSLLIRFLSSEPSRGIAFNRMFAMKEYPDDILPLYSQGYSLARYFIQQGGKRKFVEYVGEGMRTNDWTTTTRKYYGFNSLSDLQTTWVKWVREGSPSLAENPQLASAAARTPPPTTQMASLVQPQRSRIPDGALSSWQTVQAQNARAFARADATGAVFPGQATGEPAASQEFPANLSTASRPVSDGWYAKRRDQAQAVLRSPGTPEAASSSLHSPQPLSTISPQQPQAIPGHVPPPPTRSASQAGDRRILMEWTRPADQPFRGRSDLTGVAMNQPASTLR
jgi:hypothetical protein